MYLYNTLTNSKEEFKPIYPGNVRMYVCGPTVYNYAHIGNARPVVTFDLLFRILRRKYGHTRVTYVRNITDIDDKLIKQSDDLEIPVSQVAEIYTRAFKEDTEKLRVLEPTFSPKATDHIKEILGMIEALIANGSAYVTDSAVMFDMSKIDKLPLSNRTKQDLIAGARVEVNKEKRSPDDFVLWKLDPEQNQNNFVSPWGFGRPGWHIECSAMAKRYLGDVFDIHGGGQDLIFPHHENEIHQTTHVTHKDKMANYWVHNNFVTVEGKKMSKSSNNVVTIRDVIGKDSFFGNVVKYTMFKTHYRSPFDWTQKEYNRSYAKLVNILKDKPENFLPSINLPRPFMEALEDDLNTHKALMIIDSFVNKKDPMAYSMLAFMGIDEKNEFKEFFRSAETMILSDIESRKEHRRNKRYKEADEIRSFMLSEYGVELRDEKDETYWSISYDML